MSGTNPDPVSIFDVNLRPMGRTPRAQVMKELKLLFDIKDILLDLAAPLALFELTLTTLAT